MSDQVVVVSPIVQATEDIQRAMIREQSHLSPGLQHGLVGYQAAPCRLADNSMQA